MFGLGKKKSKIDQEHFILGGYDFGFDRQKSLVKMDGNRLVELKITGDEDVFEALCDQDEFEFAYGIYPPEFQALEIELGRKKQVKINHSNQNDFEVSLYFMEYNEVEINLSFHQNWISVIGWTWINGERFALDIKMKL